MSSKRRRQNNLLSQRDFYLRFQPQLATNHSDALNQTTHIWLD